MRRTKTLWVFIAAALGVGSCTETNSDDVRACELPFAENSVATESLSVIVDVAPYNDQVIALISGREAGLKLITSDLMEIPVVADRPRYADLSVELDGTVCVNWSPSGEGPIHRACGPDFQAVEHLGRVVIDGSLHVTESAELGTVAFASSDHTANIGIASATIWDQTGFTNPYALFTSAVSVSGKAFGCMVLLFGEGMRIVGEVNDGTSPTQFDIVSSSVEPSVTLCRMAGVDNELSVAFIDEAGSLFHAAANVGADGLDTTEWQSTEVKSGSVWLWFDYAAKSGEYAIVYTLFSSIIVERNRSGMLQYDVIGRASVSTGHRPHMTYSSSGDLYVVTIADVDDGSDVDDREVIVFHQVCERRAI